MKKKGLLRSILCIALAGISLFSACASASKDTKALVEKLSFTGTHDFTAPDTDVDFIKDGRTDYVLVKPAEYSEKMTTAENEFKYFFEKATGIEIKSTTDEGLTHKPENKYISLGETALFETSGISYDQSALTADGVRIITQDKTVFLLGGRADGIVHAVYTFMEIYFNLETYYKDCFVIDEDVKDLKLKNFNVTDIPDVPVRCYSSNDFGINDPTNVDYDSRMLAYRWRYRDNLNSNVMPIFKEFNNRNAALSRQHNCTTWYPRATYQQEHDGWYSTAGDQLCYLARGEKEEFEKMALVGAAKIINSLIFYPAEKYPDYEFVTLTMNDNQAYCRCDACKEVKEASGGTDTAASIILCNRIMEIVDAWMDETPCDDYTNVKAFLKEQGIEVESSAPYKRDIVLCFFAYGKSCVPPTVVYNEETKKYEVTDKRWEMRHNVGVWYAESAWDYHQDIYADINKEILTRFQIWSDIATGGMMLWHYALKHTAFTYFFDGFSWYNRDAYTVMAAFNTRYCYTQGTGGYGLCTGFSSLKTYIDAKLLWNCNQDIGPLMDNYFSAMYAEAAPIVQGIFTDMRMYSSQMNTVREFYKNSSGTTDYTSSKFWSYRVLEKWAGQFDEASALIKEKYEKIDPKLCASYLKHIEMEWISVAFAMISLYFDKEAALPVTSAEALAFKLRFRDVVAKYPLMSGGEGEPTLLEYIEARL